MLRSYLSMLLRCLVLVSVCGYLSSSVTAQPANAKPVESAEQWLEKLRAQNRGKWDEKLVMTGPIRTLSETAMNYLSNHLEEGTDCQRAAANVGHAAAFQNVVKGGFHDVAKAAVLTAREIAETLGESTTLTKVIKFGLDQAIKRIQEGLAKRPAEVHVTKAKRDGCDLVFVSIWDKAASKYEVIIYGDCHCSPLNSFTPRGKVKVNNFEIRISGKTTVSINAEKEQVLIGADVPTAAKIECDVCKTNVEPPADKPPIETPPSGGFVKGDPPKEGLCSPKPPCPECKEHADKIVAACARIKEIDDELSNLTFQLKPRQERLKTAKGTELTNLQQEINEINAEITKFSNEKRDRQNEMVNETARLKECEKTRCNKTATGGPPKKGFDACLVGSWTSIQASSQFNHWTNGGEGVLLSIGGDGKAAIDYSKMTPNLVGDNTRIWGGTATGDLSATGGNLSVRIETFNVTITFIGPGQDGITRPMRRPNGLGNLLQEFDETGARKGYSYTCDPTTLVITGVPWSSTFKRVGTLR